MRNTLVFVFYNIQNKVPANPYIKYTQY